MWTQAEMPPNIPSVRAERESESVLNTTTSIPSDVWLHAAFTSRLQKDLEEKRFLNIENTFWVETFETLVYHECKTLLNAMYIRFGTGTDVGKTGVVSRQGDKFSFLHYVETGSE
jgi:hypothetical protein